jgi:hypothetical protein
MQVENSEARRYSFGLDTLGAVAVPGSSDFFTSDSSNVWRFDSRTGQRELVVDSEALATHVASGPPGPPQPRSLALDVTGRALWIGSHGHGLFRLDIDSGSISRPLLTTEQIAQCARSTVAPHMHGAARLAGGQVYAQLERCFGRVDANNRFVVMRERIDAGPVTDAGGAVWLLAGDRFHRLDADGNTTVFTRKPDPVDNARVNVTYQVGKRLFVGVEDAPLAVLDLERKTWSKVPEVSNVQRLRAVAGREGLLAMGQARYHWVDPATLSSRELVLGPGSEGSNPALHWRDLRDLEFDGETMWVLRDNRRRPAGKSRRGLYQLSRDGYKHYDSASGYSLGDLARVVQDPSNPERLWLLRNRDAALVDFNKTTGESVLISANKTKRNKSELLATAMSDPRLKTLTTRRHETLDPDAPDLIWGVRGSGVYVKRGVTMIRRWPAKLATGPIEVIRDAQTTVWIATSEGLIEFPVKESLAELLKTAVVVGNY